MDEDELKQKILAKLEAMEEVSLKVLRAELEEELGINLLAQKDFIKEVVNESINGSEEEKPKEAKKVPVRPPPKVTPKPSQTPKSSQTRKRSQSSDNEDEDEAPQQKKKKLQQTPEGDEYIELDGKKRLTVRYFGKTLFVDIREFYMDQASMIMKPGKKGVALQVGAWETLAAHVNDVNEMIKRR